MIYKLKDEYAQDLLLSEFSLANNCLDNNFINSLFLHPIAKKISLVNKDNTLQVQDFWVSFEEFSYDVKTHKNKIYPQMHKDMKIHVRKAWSMFKKPIPLYNAHRIENKNNMIRYICIYLSPNKSKNTFDAAGIKNQDFLIQNMLNILLKSIFIEDLNKNTAYADIHSGEILLRPKVVKTTVSGYSYNLSYDNNHLIFSLHLKRFQLKDNDSITISDDMCFNNKIYGHRLSAQKLTSAGRKFLNFKNSVLANESLFICQLLLFKKLQQTFSKFNINYVPKTFSPKHLTNEFTKFENVEKINLCFIGDKDTLESPIYTDKSYLNNLFNGNQLTRKIVNSLNDILKHQLEANIFILPDEDGMTMEDDDIENKDEQLVCETINLIKKYHNSSLEVFLERNLDNLIYDEFLLNIINFDLYSQVKLYNLYANFHQLHPIVSQGIKLNYNSILDEKLTVQKEIDKKLKSIKNKANKVIKEVSLKNLIFNNKNISLKVSSNNIDILQKKRVNKHNIYSYCSLTKIEDGKFQFNEKRIVKDGDLDSLNLDFCFDDEFKDCDTIIVFDKTYLLKVIKNHKNPNIILRKDVLNQSYDPMNIIQNHINEDSSLTNLHYLKNVPDKQPIIFYPYVSRAAGKMTTQKPSNLESKSAFCILETNSNILKTFIRPSINSMNQDISKQSKIERIQLKKKNDLFYEDEEWCNNFIILEDYLSTLTLNQLIINSVSKKSILTKFTELILLN